MDAKSRHKTNDPYVKPPKRAVFFYYKFSSKMDVSSRADAMTAFLEKRSRMTTMPNVSVPSIAVTENMGKNTADGETAR